jgi:hypothetical protein
MIDTEWLYQYLEEESLHYLTQHDPYDGVVSEFYFNTFAEIDHYVEKYSIPVTLK